MTKTNRSKTRTSKFETMNSRPNTRINRSNTRTSKYVTRNSRSESRSSRSETRSSRFVIRTSRSKTRTSKFKTKFSRSEKKNSGYNFISNRLLIKFCKYVSIVLIVNINSRHNSCSFSTTAPGEGQKFGAFPAAGLLTAHNDLLPHLTITSNDVIAGPTATLQPVMTVH